MSDTGKTIALIKALSGSGGSVSNKEEKKVLGKDVPVVSQHGFIYGTTGAFEQSGYYDATDYIMLPGTTNHVTGYAFLYNDFGVAFYDIGKRFISGISGTSIGSSKLEPQKFDIDAPENAKYVRYSLNNVYSVIPDDFVLTIRSEYSRKGDTISYEYTDVPVFESNGYIWGTNGGFSSSEAGRSTEFFKIPSLKGGTVSGKAFVSEYCGVAFYDANRQFISGYADASATGYVTNFTLEIPEKARYMRWSQVYTSPSAIQNFAVTFTAPYQHNIRDVSNETVIINNYALNVNGKSINTSGWNATDYVFVGDAKRFSIQGSLYNDYGVILYNENKEIVSYVCGYSRGVNNSVKPVTIEMDVPPGVFYVRSTIYKNDGEYYTGPESYCILLYDENTEKKSYYSYIGLKTDGKALNILILGDSYSAERQWINGMVSDLPVSEIVNLGVVSAKIKDAYQDRETYPYTSRPTSSGTGNQNTLGSQVEKLKRLMTGTDLDAGEVQIYTDHSPDVVIIEGGMNDSVDTSEQESTYGEQFIVKAENVYYKDSSGTVTQGDYYIKPDDETEVDRTCFAGAYRHIAEEILTLFPDAQIFITTPSRFNYFTVNPQRYDTIAEQQIKCARLCSATVIDWNGEGNINTITDFPSGSGTSEDPYTVYGGTKNTWDGLHPNERGGRAYGRLAAKVIKQRFLAIRD